MNETIAILCALSETEPTNTADLLNRLGLKALDEGALRLYATLQSFEELQMIVVTRQRGTPASMLLTPLGAERAREATEGAQRS